MGKNGLTGFNVKQLIFETLRLDEGGKLTLQLICTLLCDEQDKFLLNPCESNCQWEIKIAVFLLWQKSFSQFTHRKSYKFWFWLNIILPQHIRYSYLTLYKENTLFIF